MDKVFRMNFLDPERIAGLLLISALSVPILLIFLFSLRGNLSDVFLQIGGVGRNPFVRNLSLSGWVIASLLSLAGFNMMTYLLRQEGENLFSSMALTAMIITTILLVLESTIHLAFGAWASEIFLRTGSEPALYSVIFKWASVIMQRVYVPVGYLGLILYGFALIKTEWLPAWTGLLSIGWGGGMLILFAVSGTTLPATLLVPGAVIGAVLFATG